MKYVFVCVLSLVISNVITVSGSIFKLGYNPQLKRFCRGYQLYVPIPWDCSGYIQCHGWLSIMKRCPPGLFYNPKILSCDWPYRRSEICPSLEERVKNYCKIHRSGLFPHPEKCAEYFDCSQPRDIGLGPFHRECRYPTLFDVRVFRCTHKVYHCGDRNKPQTECDYVMNNNKPSCKDQCYGKPDGYYNEPGKFLSPTFIVCENGKTIGSVQNCPSGQIFDSIHRKCTSHLPEAQAAVFCDNNPNAVLAVTESCAKYIKCNSLGINIIQECPYPDLFSTTTLKCENYTSVSCGDRFEPRSYCEYSQSKCSTCPPCDDARPSCIGLPDGHTHGSRLKKYSNSYFKCVDGRTLEVHCGADVCGELHQFSLMCGGFFNPDTKQCQDHIPEGEADAFCKSNPNGRIGVTESCAKFIRCNAKNGDSIVQECIYYGLFSTETMSCSSFENVECGVRPELHDFCHYEASTCPGCEPCHEARPSCAGKPDGFNAIDTKLFTAQFLQCISNRTVRVLFCEEGAVFHPTLKMCVRELEPENADTYCSNHPNGIIGDASTCAGFINCTASGVIRSECSYPDLFNVDTMQCDDYKNVKCGRRPEPRSLCEYSKYNCSTCEPCDEVKPSCVGLKDGDNAVRGKEFTAQYLTCVDGRTMGVNKCSKGIFHPRKKTCVTEIGKDDAAAFCAANPGGIIGVEESCAQYIVCNSTDGSNSLKECPYPQLFSTDTMRCEEFKNVTCADRPEPQSYCEYKASDCTGCPPCDDVYPSCVGKSDGDYSFPGSIYTKKRMSCLSNRTLLLEDCTENHAFHPEELECTPYIPKEQADKYCADNPGSKIGVEESCAKYIICGSDGKAEIKECQYSQLFSTLTFTCEEFNNSTVNCGGRHEPQDYCEYEPSSCTACPACDGSQSTCVSKTDGRHTDKPYTRDSYFCSQNRTLGWDQCPENEVYDPDVHDCVSMLPEDKNSDYCQNNPGTKFPIVNSCARYFDCGINEEPAVKECPYPQLFDETTLSCEDFDKVDCGTRDEPQSYCEYKSSQCNTCAACNETKPSCVGLPDGLNGVTGQLYTSKFIRCMKNRTLDVSTCEPKFIFSPTEKKCVNAIGENEATAYCNSNSEGIIAVKESCAKYINCTAGGVQECTYPDLFSTETMRCEEFTKIDCDDRDEPQTFCEYSASTCASCPSCNDAKPSCVGQPDGYNTVRNKEYTSTYIYCSKNRTLSLLDCDIGYFDPLTKECSTEVTPDAAEDYCAANPDTLIAHNENCAQYYNCSEGNKVLQECPYPELFSTEKLRCDDFNWVECGDRNEPISFCDYKNNQCDPSDTSCTPCVDKFPSCVGLPDGDNPYPGKLYTPRFIVCESERTIKEDRCIPGIFLPDTRKCTTQLDPETARKYCDANPGVIATTVSCAQYIDCRENNGTALVECKYPQLFDAYKQKCVDNFTEVDCGDRREPQTYCDYRQSGCDPSNPPTCETCKNELPSCVGLSDGKHPVPGKEHTGEYIVCLGNRTLEKDTCDPGMFDPDTRACVRSIKPGDKDNYCTKNPNGIIGSTENCAQYYNCSAGGDKTLMECPYSDLFSTVTMKCEAFSEVDCGTRPEPEDYCGYKQSGCIKSDPTTCEDCKNELPSCAGFPEGLNPIIGLEYTTTYIQCTGNRTILKGDCTAGVFSPIKRECVKAIHPDEVTAYCKSNPQGIIGNTENCAEYFKCSESAAGMVEQECTYPDLFSLELMSCANYSLVSCGSRHEPLDFCEYSASACAGCPPCGEAKPSCVGKNDGFHAASTKKYSPQYVYCADNRTIEVKTCDRGIFDPDINECSRSLPLSEARSFCAENPNGLIGNSEHCAQYFKCNGGNLQLKECIYPALFSLESLTCEYFDKVNCTSRHEPKNLCGYAGEKCPAGDTTCIPCDERMPSCEDKPDGLNAIDGKEFTEQYIECAGGRTLTAKTCANGKIFHPTEKTCIDKLRPDDADDFCKSRPDGIMASAENCAQFINCSAPNNISECPYPQLFNIQTKACDDFENVDCGSRYEPEAPCEYEANKCTSGTEECISCDKRETDCRGKSDGSHNFHGNPFTSPWVECKGNRTIKQESCSPGVFDFVLKTCTPEIRQESLDEWCDKHPNDLIENHKHCGQFINCTTRKVEECPYPQLYNPDLRKCTDFKEVHCGSRKEPVNPCDYDQFACDPAVDPDCSPCNSIPFCEGLDNGDHQYPQKPFTKFYITCDTGRVFPDKECPVQHIFDPIQRKCTDFMNKTSVETYCSRNPSDMFINELNCAKLIDCKHTPPMEECPYPQLVDAESKTCNDFVSVICGSRYEPQAPCEYEAKRNDCPDCEKPCDYRHPPCVGLPDGKNEVPGRKGMHYYMMCKINRTMELLDCQGVKYLPETKECDKIIVPKLLNIYCTDHPKAVFPSPEHCAQFFDCSKTLERPYFIKYQQECPVYGQLYDVFYENCVPFMYVDCEDRPLHKDRCDHISGLMECEYDPQCKNCTDYYPSCIDKPDGMNVKPGMENTQYYIVCFQEFLTEHLQTCNMGIFNPTEKICESSGLTARYRK